MHARLRVFALTVAATGACLAFAGSASATTTAISGSVANGGCDAARPVPVSGPSRIEVEVSAASSSNSVLGEILAPGGGVVATGSYDTPSGGGYAVRVCSEFTSMDPAQIQYTGLIGTGPAGQPAIPRQPADTSSSRVLSATKTLANRVSGKGAILTRSGLAWFTVRMAPKGTASVTVFDPVHHRRTIVKGMQLLFGANSVVITGNGLKLMLVDKGTNERITFTSSRFKASGKIVRGGFQLTA
jgi:hypothetical protein